MQVNIQTKGGQQQISGIGSTNIVSGFGGVSIVRTKPIIPVRVQTKFLGDSVIGHYFDFMPMIKYGGYFSI